MKSILYIGEFPPPYGGVTLKNEFIKQQLLDSLSVEYFNLVKCKKNPLFLLRMVQLLWKKRNCNILIGVGRQFRLYIILYIIKLIGGNHMLNQTSVFVMASTLSLYANDKPKFVNLLSKCQALYIELETMIQEMEPYNLSNCKLLPNCRTGGMARKPHPIHPVIRLLFFSRIHNKKGVPILFDMMDELDSMGVSYVLDFWGKIDSDYYQEFWANVKKHSHCKYCGLFDAVNGNLYKKMNEYDVFLLPTTWHGESCCGAIIESKMAGIPAIVSDWHYNRELVRLDEGYVIKNLLGIEYAECIKKVIMSPKDYDKVAYAAYESRKRYDFATYRTQIRNYLTQYS